MNSQWGIPPEGGDSVEKIIKLAIALTILLQVFAEDLKILIEIVRLFKALYNLF